MRVTNVGIRAVGVSLPATESVVVAPGRGATTVRAADRELTTYRMGELATQSVLEQAGKTAEDLNGQYYLVCNEAPSDYLFELPGRQMLDRLGAGNVHTYNLIQGGNQALLALRLMACHLQVDTSATFGLVVSPQHWEYHSVGRLLGDAVLSDGAGALMMERGWPRHRVLSICTRTDGKFHNVVYTEVGGWAVPIAEEPCREGRFVYRVHDTDGYAELMDHTLDVLDKVLEQALAESGTRWDQIGQVVLDTATPQLRQQFLARFPVDESIVVGNGLNGAWMCSAGLLLAFERLLANPTVPAGTRVLATSVGVDGNWAAAVVEV